MALEAFNKLKERKKVNIFNAISNCLRNVSYDDLTVNDIVNEADISRGSFYNYFTDKRDAVKCLIGSNLRNHFKMYLEAIKESDYKLFEGTKKSYIQIANILSDEINLLVLKNIKFFSELFFEVVKSKMYEKELNNIIEWLITNTNEGKTTLNTYKKMGNVLDLILMLTMHSIFAQVVLKDEPFADNSDFIYKLEIIEKGII